MLPNRTKVRDYVEESRLFGRRAIVAFCFILAMVGVLLANLYHLQVSDHKDYQTRSNDNRIKILPIAPNRGRIFDRNGVLLAENRAVSSLELIAREVKDIDDTLARIQAYIPLTPDEIKRFRKKLRQTARFKPVIIKDQLNEEEIARFSAHQYQFRGVNINARLKRYYPFGEILTHTIGYVSRINDRDLRRLSKEGKEKNYQGTYDIGKIGVERYYEDMLHGTKGFQKVEVNSHGRVIRVIDYVPPVPGKDLVLNLDIELQTYVYKQLDGRRGSAVVIDPSDNGVLAMVSSPSYDPNAFVNGISGREYSELLNDPDRPLVNRITLGVYPPGSTIKPFMAIAALQEKVVTPFTHRNDHGMWRLPKTKNKTKVWRDWKRWGHGNVDLSYAIEESVDTFFYQIAYDLGIDRISSWMNKFGFGHETGIDIPEETSANMPTREWKFARHRTPWYQGDTIPVGIGQGYWTATPIQLAKATSVLINHGKVMAPHLLRAAVERDDTKEIEEKAEVKTNFPMSEVANQYWDLSIDAMRLVNHGKHGTGRRTFKTAKYISGGKSGTAQVFGLKENQKYKADELSSRLHDHALYIGFAPYKHPKYVTAVVLENGGSGSKVGGPFVRKIFDHLLDDSGQLAKH